MSMPPFFFPSVAPKHVVSWRTPCLSQAATWSDSGGTGEDNCKATTINSTRSGEPMTPQNKWSEELRQKQQRKQQESFASIPTMITVPYSSTDKEVKDEPTGTKVKRARSTTQRQKKHTQEAVSTPKSAPKQPVVSRKFFTLTRKRHLSDARHLTRSGNEPQKSGSKATSFLGFTSSGSKKQASVMSRDRGHITKSMPAETSHHPADIETSLLNNQRKSKDGGAKAEHGIVYQHTKSTSTQPVYLSRMASRHKANIDVVAAESQRREQSGRESISSAVPNFSRRAAPQMYPARTATPHENANTNNSSLVTGDLRDSHKSLSEFSSTADADRNEHETHVDSLHYYHNGDAAPFEALEAANTALNSQVINTNNCYYVAAKEAQGSSQMVQDVPNGRKSPAFELCADPILKKSTESERESVERLNSTETEIEYIRRQLEQHVLAEQIPEPASFEIESSEPERVLSEAADMELEQIERLRAEVEKMIGKKVERLPQIDEGFELGSSEIGETSPIQLAPLSKYSHAREGNVLSSPTCGSTTSCSPDSPSGSDASECVTSPGVDSPELASAYLDSGDDNDYTFYNKHPAPCPPPQYQTFRPLPLPQPERVLIPPRKSYVEIIPFTGEIRPLKVVTAVQVNAFYVEDDPDEDLVSDRERQYLSKKRKYSHLQLRRVPDINDDCEADDESEVGVKRAAVVSTAENEDSIVGYGTS